MTRLEAELRDAKTSLSEKEAALATACEERSQLLKSLQSEGVSGEDRRRKFMMLQAAFKTKEEELNNEILELEAKITELYADANAATNQLERTACELGELQKNQGVLITSTEELKAHCTFLETELSASQKVDN